MQRPALLVIVRHAESMRNQVKKDTVYFADDAARRVLRGTPDHLVELTEAGTSRPSRPGTRSGTGSASSIASIRPDMPVPSRRPRVCSRPTPPRSGRG